MTKFDLTTEGTWPKDGSRSLVVTLNDGVTYLTNFNLKDDVPTFTIGSTFFRTRDQIDNSEIDIWETVQEHRERIK